MRTRTLAPPLLATLLLALGVAAAQPAAPADAAPAAVAGAWRGAVEVSGSPLEVAVTLSEGADGWTGTIDIPAQGAAGLPLQGVSVEGADVAFAIAGIPGEPTFEGTVDGDAMSGTFTQSGGAFPFALSRADAPTPAAPGAAGAAPPAVPDADAAPGPDAAPPVAPGPDVVPPTPPGAADADRYEDPQGRFDVPVPTGWRASGTPGGVRLESPEGGIRVDVVVSPGDDPEAAVAAAWRLVDPDFDVEIDDTLEPPSEPGIERTVVVNYDPDDDEEVYQAVAQLHDGTVYTLLIDAELAALQRRAAQLQIVASGFEIASVSGTDLTDAEPGEVADVLPELEAFIARAMASFDVPGASVAIVQDGEIVHAAGYGVRRAGGDEPVTPTTRMMIGSTGKTLTSMLVATLVDDGLLAWDTPVAEILPSFAVADPELSGTITVRNLLCACTGVPRRDLELFFNAEELTAEGIVASLRTFEFFTDFGEAFQYSNQLVATAGYAAAAAAGAAPGELLKGYDEALEERVLEPIGMGATTLSFDEVLAAGDHATPHQQSLEAGGYEPIDPAVERVLLPVAPAGVHWSTAADMGRYLLTVMAGGVAPDGDRVVSEANLRVTWEPQVPVSATESYGLGWFVGEYEGLEWIYHSGNTLGFTSEFVFVPEAEVGIVVLTNAQASNAFNGAVAVRLLELLYDRPAASVEQTEFAAEQLRTGLAEARAELQDAVDPAAVEPFLGRYRHEALGEMVLEMEGDQLVMDVGEFRAEVRPLQDDEGAFDGYVTYGVPLTGLPLEFRDEDGARTVVLGQGAVRYAFTPLD